MKILFQGDSITDTNRTPFSNSGSPLEMGAGYANIIAARLSYENAGEYNFSNFGISGNRIVDVYARIKKDCWAHNPDVISLLIGVNDLWHELGNGNGVDPERFERFLCMFIEDTKKVLPNVKFMLLEPFVLKGAATLAQLADFEGQIKFYQAAVKRTAQKYGQVFVPLQEHFNAMLSKAGDTYWAYDGVHPTGAGHFLIAERWIEAFNKL